MPNNKTHLIKSIQKIHKGCVRNNAALVYFLLGGVVGVETRSWLCVLCAAPFAALGFVSYNGMTAEKLFITIIKYLITPKALKYETDNLYESLTEEAIYH